MLKNIQGMKVSCSGTWERELLRENDAEAAGGLVCDPCP